MYCVFVSHATGDSAVAQNIINQLSASKLEVWNTGINFNEFNLDRRQNGLMDSHFVLILLTEAAAQTSVCHREWEKAKKHERPMLVLQLKDIRPTLMPRILKGTEYLDLRKITNITWIIDQVATYIYEEYCSVLLVVTGPMSTEDEVDKRIKIILADMPRQIEERDTVSKKQQNTVRVRVSKSSYEKLQQLAKENPEILKQNGIEKFEKVETDKSPLGKPYPEAVRVTLVKSSYGRKEDHIATLKALKLTHINASRTLVLTPSIQGMLAKISYLVRIESVEDYDPSDEQFESGSSMSPALI